MAGRRGISEDDVASNRRGRIGQSLEFFDVAIVAVISIDGNDQVPAQHDGDISQISAFTAATKSRQIRGAPRGDLHNQQTLIRRQADFIREFGSDRNCTHAQCGTFHPAQRHQVVQHRDGGGLHSLRQVAARLAA